MMFSAKNVNLKKSMRIKKVSLEVDRKNGNVFFNLGKQNG